jgi:hypothetical protein
MNPDVAKAIPELAVWQEIGAFLASLRAASFRSSF